jgi:single-strand DNA-binding protein
MNVAALVGRLTRDPELRYTPNGIATCSFTIAVDDPFAKGDQKADFIPIVTWKQTAESSANYLKKGHLCAVEGRIKTRNYEKDGRKIYVTEILASGVKFLEPKKAAGESNNHTTDERPPIDISEDDLPF